MNKPFLLFFFLLLVVLSCTRCKEECDDPTNPDCPNYVDPCAGHSEVTAIIEIAEQAAPFFYSQIFEATDIVIDGKNVRFRCPVENAQYTWILGTETIHDQEFMRYFSGYAGQNISVTLIVQKEPDLACFPNDDGIDTLTTSFYVIDKCEPSIEGVFRGAWDELPTDSFNVSILAAPDWDDPDGVCNGFYISNFSKNNPDSIDVSYYGWRTNYKAYINTDLASVDSFNGYLFLSQDKQHLRAEYKLYIGNGEFAPHVFRGYRIN